MNKWSKRIPIVLVVFGVLALLILAVPTVATFFQLPTVPPLPSPPNARIVYLTTNPNAPANEFTAATRINQQLGAQAVSTWEQVIEADQAARIDALIIDSSALSSVDKGWVVNAYRRGTVIAGFNISGSQMASLVNNACIASDNFANYASGSFFIVVSSSISGSPDDVNRVLDIYSRSCGETGAEGVQGTTSVGFRHTSERLDSENTFNIFARVLASHLDK